jgi:hypothetical protein
MLEFYMGKNDDERRQFIMERLRDEIDEANWELRIAALGGILNSA